MEHLTDDSLVEAYILGKKLNLDNSFLQKLRTELIRRSINIQKNMKKKQE
ncbi:sporulation histidine kinase inhibitor Sda [Virgibacillus salexigens]